jgi:hypothetical protein
VLPAGTKTSAGATAPALAGAATLLARILSPEPQISIALISRIETRKLTDGLQIGIGEDESNVAFDKWKDTLVIWRIIQEAFDGTTNLSSNLMVSFRGLPEMSRISHTMVFLPIKTTPSPRRACRISCICWELTLSTVTMKMLLYSLKRGLADERSGWKRINLEGT